MACPFCPYERNVISNGENTVDEYLAALNIEMGSVAPSLRAAAVQSLYLGGGTATVLTDAQLTALFQRLRREFQLGSDALICVETSPNALIQAPSKMKRLRDLGVTRVSVGVQTLSPMALQSEGRTHRPDETLRMLETLIQEIPLVNVDLMQDMPGQTDADLENDLTQIAKLPVSQVTWYVERLRKSRGQYPDSYHSVERRLWLRDRMKELSYEPRPGGRFVYKSCDDDIFKSARCGLNTHMVGLGPSAYGHVPGYFYRNMVNTAGYMGRVAGGLSPIATGAALRKVDVFAADLASGIRYGVDFKPDSALNGYVTTAKRRLDTLIRHELVEHDATTNKYQITVDGPGWAYEEEICSMFVPQDVVDRIRANHHPWWFGSRSME